jgi:ribosomal protein S18 acetylase RimI-like enzyme
VTLPFEIRPATDADRHGCAAQFARVAMERDGIATEGPVDVAERSERWDVDSSIVAVAEGEIIGSLYLGETTHGFGEIGMSIDNEWRGRGVGSALMEAAIARAREHGLHKLSLEVFAHNEAGLALYRKYGFVEEGRRVKQYRRQSGELWDSIVMGLLL